MISAGSLLVRKDARMRLSVTDKEFSLYLSALTLQVEKDKNKDKTFSISCCQDASEYTCEVDIMARPISITHRLEVLVAPRVQCKDSRVTLRKGESYTLRCSAQGEPNPRVSWSRRTGQTSFPLTSGLSLHLAGVDRQAEGEYVCTAANGVGQPAVASVAVSVLCK